MLFSDQRDNYNSIGYNKLCFSGFHGKNYSLRKDKLTTIGCNKWHCPKCRPIKKFYLMMDAINYSAQLDLTRHFVLTFGGTKYRDLYTWEDSYIKMMSIWDKFKMVIQYHHGQFDYLMFPRAQQDGYCHLHVLLSSFIPKDFLNTKRKLYEKQGLGFLKIKRNMDVVEYLTKHIRKDNEYIIPTGYRHMTGSRGIVRIQYGLSPWHHLENQRFEKETTLKEMEEKLLERFGRLLPFEEYLKEFADLKENKTRLLSGTYQDGKLVKPAELYVRKR